MMDVKNILDQLLGSGKELATKTRDFAESKLGIPESGEQRDAAMSNLGKGAAVGGLLALLLGTKAGRSMTGKAAKYGSIAAVAAVAYKSYQAWQSGQQAEPTASALPPELPGKAITDFEGGESNRRSLTLLQAMLAAANADGHVDAAERSRIETHLQTLELETDARQLIEQALRNPLTVEELASRVDSPAAASELYLLSSLVVDDRDPVEQRYLERLATALQLPSELVARLNADTTY
jgi:uncharacterized membrane protein YebE (DUF533 family)